MDKNIAAFMRSDARTIQVRPPDAEESKTPRRYTYVTHISGLIPGDYVVVDIANRLCVAEVTRVDDEVLIEPNDTVAYKWVIGRVDMAAHLANAKRNEQITKLVADASRKNMRRVFAEHVLNGLSDDAKKEVLALTNGAPNADA